MSERTLSAPVVLAVASAMVSVGAAGLWWAYGGTETAPAIDPSTVPSFDETSAQQTAETFLDAWRKRNHEVCRSLAHPSLLPEIDERQQSDDRLSGEDRDAISLWQQMADRLTFVVGEESMEGDDVRLSGVARGSFMNAPYERDVSFTLTGQDDGFLVKAMDLGPAPVTLEMPEDGAKAPTAEDEL